MAPSAPFEPHREGPEAHPGERTEDLASRAQQAADPQAFGELYRRVAPALYAWASLHVRPGLRAQLDPEDLLQEVACRAWERFASWDPAKGVFRAWIFGIGRHVLHEMLRRLASRPSLAGSKGGAPRDAGSPAGARAGVEATSASGLHRLPDTATSISRAVARDEGLARLVRRLDELPEDERRLLLYRGVEGLPHAEVARLLGSSPEAVAKRWQRLRDALASEPLLAEIAAP